MRKKQHFVFTRTFVYYVESTSFKKAVKDFKAQPPTPDSFTSTVVCEETCEEQEF